MTSAKTLIFFLFYAFVLSNGQQYSGRVAPGVPPRQYNPPGTPSQTPSTGNTAGKVPPGVPPKQYNPSPPNEAHHQEHSPPSKSPPSPGHGYLPDAKEVLEEREHIQQHMEVPIDTSNMNAEELHFHYFKIHDTDNNHKLDGIELAKRHTHSHGGPLGTHGSYRPQSLSDENISQMVDSLLERLDKNRDGMIDYLEYSLSNRNPAYKG